MTERLKEFLQQKKWRQLKKTDWIAAALVGVLLLVVAMPSGGTGVHISENKKEDTAQEKTEQKYEKKDYAEYLEHKLEQVLGQMEGVGKVSVMVTVADQGEDIIEKDKTEHTSTVTNTDSGSMEMTTEKESGEETVYEESGGEKAPYVSKEILPEIEGVLVVAEGGDSPRIVSDISDAVKALFQVEAHRINGSKDEFEGGWNVKKIFQKNQLIITALALMIAVAGYFSYMNNHIDDGTAAETAANAGTDALNAEYEISDEDPLAAEDIFTDEGTGEELALVDGTETADAGTGEDTYDAAMQL